MAFTATLRVGDIRYTVQSATPVDGDANGLTTYSGDADADRLDIIDHCDRIHGIATAAQSRSCP